MLNRDFLMRNFISVIRFHTLNRDFSLNRDSLKRDFTVIPSHFCRKLCNKLVVYYKKTPQIPHYNAMVFKQEHPSIHPCVCVCKMQEVWKADSR